MNSNPVGLGGILWDQAMANQEDLDVALDLHYSFYQFRRDAITAFGSKLINRLKEVIVGSDIAANFNVFNHGEQEIVNIFDQYSGFGYEHKLVSGLYVGSESQASDTNRWIIGVGRPKELTGFDVNDLGKMLNENHGYGNSNDSWIWWQNCEGMYFDWRNRDAVRSIALSVNDNNIFAEFSSYYVDKILGLAATVNKFISP